MSSDLDAPDNTASLPGVHALGALRYMMATDGRDWSLDNADARLYAVICGWKRKAMTEVAARHGWSTSQVRHLRRLRADYVRMCLNKGMRP